MCQDTRCTDGITACMGPDGCNGHGAVSPKGGKYRQARTGPLPTWAMDHAECNGTGMVNHGCKPKLAAAELATLAGKPWVIGEQRWSSAKGMRIDAPRPDATTTRKPRTRKTPVRTAKPVAVPAAA